jgi:hypothetical protein
MIQADEHTPGDAKNADVLAEELDTRIAQTV